MAAFDFPSSPSVNQTYTANGVTWKWNGTMWMRVSGAGYLEKIEEGNSKIEVDDSGSGNVTITTDGTERLRIDSSGRLLVGHTSSVSSLADVKIEAVSNAGAEIHLARNDSSVTDGNAIGILRFYGNDGGTYQECAAIKGQADGTHADGDKPSRLTFFTTASGSNSSTERLRITSAGRIGINQASPDAMLQVDYDEGNSEVGLRLRAYNASGSKTWQLSEVNGNAGVFSIRNATNSTEGLDIHGDGHVRVPTGDLRVGDNTDSNAGTKTISVGSVSSGSGGIGIFANPTNGNSFVQFGDGTSSADQYRGYMNYRHADDSLRLGTAGSDRLHIAADGKIGLDGMANPVAKLHIGTEDDSALTAQTVFVEGAKTGYANYTGLPQNQLCVYDNTVSTAGSGGAISFAANCGGSQQTWIAAIESQRDSSTNDASNYAGSIVFWTRPAQSTPTEKLRITSGGLVGINDTSPDATLSVGGSTAFIDVGAAGGNRGKIGYSSNDLYFGTSSSSGEFIFKNNVNSNDNPASSGTERFRITSSGHVLRPTMAAACCTTTGQTTLSTFNTSYQTIAVNVEGYDNANNFNTSNYRFTAPETGFYQVGCNVQLENGSGSNTNNWMYFYPIINGASSPSTSTGGNNADFDPTDTFYYNWTYTTLLKLSQNDYVEWKYRGNLTSVNLKGGVESTYYFYQVG